MLSRWQPKQVMRGGRGTKMQWGGRREEERGEKRGQRIERVKSCATSALI